MLSVHGLIRRRALLAVLSIAVLALQPQALPAQALEVGAPIDIGGVFHPGAPKQVAWRVIKPAAWNGDLVLDLDFAPGGYTATQREWFLSKGYAIGGIQRTQNETAYELKEYVDDLVQVRQNLIDAGASTPRRTIAFGASRGGFVARKAVEYRPDIFVGGVAFAGGGAGIVATWISKAQSVWALKTLVDPAAALTINRLPDIPPGANYGPSYQQDVALGQLVTLARSTPQGMARLVLAGAFQQFTPWGSGPTRPAPEDYETQGLLVAASFAFGNPQFVHKEIEVMSGGPITWNHCVDFAAMLADSGDLARVQYWYQKAGLDLQADLRTLEEATRYSADPAALQRAEQIGTYTAASGPVLAVKTIGDSADPVALDEAYERTFASAGNSANLRTVFIERAGHSSQSIRERLTAFATLIERLDTGQWPDTSPAGMNARAVTIAQGSSVPDTALGTSLFIPFEPPAALRTWDFTNWGEYFAEYAESLHVPHVLTNGLRNFAHHLQKGRTDQACRKLEKFEADVARLEGRKLSPAAAADLTDKSTRLRAEIGC